METFSVVLLFSSLLKSLLSTFLSRDVLRINSCELLALNIIYLVFPLLYLTVTLAQLIYILMF